MKISRRLFVRASACAGLASALPLNSIFGNPKGSEPGISTSEIALPKAVLLDPLHQLTAGKYSPLINQKFTIHLPEASQRPVVVTLIEVKPLATAEKAGREGFSLLFRGPVDKPLPQNVYPIEHQAIGKFSLLKVPVKTDRRGMYYEIVFNRLRLPR
jgi:hypothetical protein